MCTFFCRKKTKGRKKRAFRRRKRKRKRNSVGVYFRHQKLVIFPDAYGTKTGAGNWRQECMWLNTANRTQLPLRFEFWSAQYRLYSVVHTVVHTIDHSSWTTSHTRSMQGVVSWSESLMGCCQRLFMNTDEQLLQGLAPEFNYDCWTCFWSESSSTPDTVEQSDDRDNSVRRRNNRTYVVRIGRPYVVLSSGRKIVLL